MLWSTPLLEASKLARQKATPYWIGGRQSCGSSPIPAGGVIFKTSCESDTQLSLSPSRSTGAVQLAAEQWV